MTDPAYRCSECGVLRPPISFSTTERGPARCDAHPDAVVLEWDGAHQAAAIWVDQYLTWRTWAEVHAVIESAPESNRKRVLLVVAPLMEAWGGSLPERTLKPSATPTGANPLFAPSLRERLMQ